MDAIQFPEFVPHPLLRGPHLQTIFGSLARTPRIAYSARQHIVDLEDNDQVVIHDDCPATWREGRRVALLLHGVSGSHASPYLVRATARLNAIGVRVFRLDMRGCGAGLAIADRPGHAGRSEDVVDVLAAIEKVCPGSPVTMVGYSMGGNIALKLLGECGDTPPGLLDRAIVVSPPIDLAACCAQIERGLNWIYQRSFVRRLVAQIRRRRLFSKTVAAIPLEPLPRRICEFDARFTAPLSGFKGVDDYYRRCSAAPLLGSIRVQTLVITAANDPLVPVELFDKHARSDAIEMHITPCGGHLGYYGISGIDPDRWWLDWRIIDRIGPLGF
jgi:predicted alpha/beta-fold hydrolase